MGLATFAVRELAGDQALCCTEFSKGGNREGLEVIECQQLRKEEEQV